MCDDSRHMANHWRLTPRGEAVADLLLRAGEIATGVEPVEEGPTDL